MERHGGTPAQQTLLLHLRESKRKGGTHQQIQTLLQSNPLPKVATVSIQGPQPLFHPAKKGTVEDKTFPIEFTQLCIYINLLQLNFMAGIIKS